MLFGPPPGLGRPIWALISAITVALVVLHAWQVGPSVLSLAAGALLVFAAGAALLPATAPGSTRLPTRWAWIAALFAVLAQCAMVWDAADGHPDGYAPWYTRGATIVCVAVILRHRAGIGWIGALAGYICAAAVAGDVLGEWGVLVLRQSAALLAMTVFAVLLGRNERAVAALRDEEHARLRAIHFREAVQRERRGEAARIRQLATGTLQRIAEGETSAELRHEAMLLEGTLRDILRGGRLASGPVPDAARAARARGVDVALLDDLGEGQSRAPAPDAMLSWVAERLVTAAPPRATVRLAAAPGNEVTVSFFAESSGAAPEFLTLPAATPRGN